jgi:hypothetical protein
MYRLFAIILAACILQLAPVAASAQGLNIVVMGEDADEDSVPRGNRIFNRVIAALTEEMNVQGHDVYDETAIAMDINPANRVRRRDSELIEVARAVQNPPLDVVVVFSIYASVREGAYSEVLRPDVRIPGRILNLRTGQQIGSFEIDGLDLPPLPVVCERECLLEEVGNHAAIMGAELAAALTLKLDGFVGSAPADASAGAIIVTQPSVGGPVTTADGCDSLPTAYVIRFDGFTTEEITALEEYVNSYSCVQSARPVRASERSAEYWYETRSDSARLNRNLRLTLEHMGVEGQLKFSGNTMIVTKVATR